MNATNSGAFGIFTVTKDIPQMPFSFPETEYPPVTSANRPCTNDHGAVKQLCHKTTTIFHQKWTRVRWQYCPLCGRILPD